MKRALSRSIFLAALVATPASAFASAFQLPDVDASATGRAGAVTANPNNPSAIWYNPAAVGALEGVQIDIGFNVILPQFDFQAPDGTRTKAESQNFFVPNLYATYKPLHWLAFGAGVAPTYGLGVKWPDSSPGRAQILEQTLQSFTISAMAALDFSHWVDGLRVGGGIDLTPANVYLAKAVPLGTDSGSVALNGTAFGIGGRVGVQFRPSYLYGVGLGVTYRSATDLTFAGNANFNAPPQYRTLLPPDGKGKTALTLPQNISAGIGWRWRDRLELEVDVDWTNWSTSKSLNISLPDNSVAVTPENWRDTIALRIGGEYTFFQQLTIRLGYVYDQSPVPASTLTFALPDTDRSVLTGGVGYQIIRQLRADLAAEFILPSSRKTGDAQYQPVVKGTYDVSAVVVGFNLVAKFGEPKPAVTRDEEPAVLAPAPASMSIEEPASQP